MRKHSTLDPRPSTLDPRSGRYSSEILKVGLFISATLISSQSFALSLTGTSASIALKFVQTTSTGAGNSCSDSSIGSVSECSIEDDVPKNASVSADYKAVIDCQATIKYKIDEIGSVPAAIYCTYNEQQTRSYYANGAISWGEPMYGPYPYYSFATGGKGKGKYTVTIGSSTVTDQVSVIGTAWEEGYGRGTPKSASTSNNVSITIELLPDGLATSEVVGTTTYWKQKYKCKKTVVLGGATMESSAAPFDIIWTSFFNGGASSYSTTKGITTEI